MEKIFFELFVFIIGASIGSFLNVLIDRLPKEESINGRSHCDFCGKKIAWYDLIPVFLFFILRGKTRCCKKKLSFQYPVIELITGLIFVGVIKDGPYFESLTRTVLMLSILSSLIVIFVSDLKYHLISDYMLLALFIFSVIFHLMQLIGSENPTPTLGVSTIYNYLQLFITIYIPSGLIISFPIWLIYFISRERAMGLGDVYLAAIMGFLLGWQAGLLALYIAFVTGAIFGLIAIIFKNKKFKSKIAFGPFLVIGTVIMLFWGERIMEMIKKTYGL